LTTDRAESGLDRRIAEIRGESTSSDRSVHLECDAIGRLTSLYVADYAMDAGPDHLAATLVEAHRTARAAAVRQALEALESDLALARRHDA